MRSRRWLIKTWRIIVCYTSQEVKLDKGYAIVWTQREKRLLLTYRISSWQQFCKMRKGEKMTLTKMATSYANPGVF
jgi:hypothetical protein